MTSRYLELAPSNKSTDNKYAFKKGYSQLDFTIPEGNFVLDPSSVRLVGDIRFFKTDASPPVAPLTTDQFQTWCLLRNAISYLEKR